MDTALTLSTDMIIVLGLVAFTMLMFVLDRMRPDATALIVLVALGLTGLVPSTQLFDGFSGSAVISLVGTMILAAGLDRTGMLNRVAVWMLRKSRGMETRLVLLSAGFSGTLSAFMQNPAVTSLMLPVASRLSGRTGIALPRLLMPIAACVMMGGSLTMIGNSPLIVHNDLMLSANRNLPPGAATLKPFEMFAPLPVGIALMICALAYFHWVGKRHLRTQDDGKGVTPARTERYFAQAYGIDGEVFELTIFVAKD